MEICYFCRKGILEDKRVTVDFRWGTIACTVNHDTAIDILK